VENLLSLDGMEHIYGSNESSFVFFDDDCFFDYGNHTLNNDSRNCSSLDHLGGAEEDYVVTVIVAMLLGLIILATIVGESKFFNGYLLVS